MASSRSARPPAFAVGRVAMHRALSTHRAWWVIACAAILTNMIVTGAVAFVDTAPVFAFDEIHHLLMARMVAGFPAPDGSGAGYYPGWGVLLAPLWWIWDDPSTIYSAALAVGWIVGVATILPLALLVRRVRLDLPRALTVAAVVSTLPARVAQADNVFSERLLFLFVVLTALAAFRLWERPTYGRAVLFAIAVGATYFTHVRMLTLVLASVVWVVGFALKNMRVALVALAALIASSLLANRLGVQLDEWLRRNPMDRGATFLDSISDTRPGLLLRTILGQLWNQIIGSYGLFAIGIVILVVWCIAELRRLRLGRATWLAGTLTASFAVSTLTWALDKRLYSAAPRLDAWIYGRYAEPITALVCALALAVLIRGVRRRIWIWSALLFTAVTVPVLLWVAPQAPTGGSVTPAHIGGLMPWAWALPDDPSIVTTHLVPTFANQNSFWLWASASVAAAMILYLLVRRLSWAAPLVVLVLSCVGAAGVNAASDDYRHAYAHPWQDFAALQAVGTQFGPLEAGYDYGCRRSGRDTGVGMNQLSFALLPDITLTPYFRGEPIPRDADLILSCADSPELADLGAVPLRNYEIYSSVAWIMPGQLQNVLAEQGALELSG